MNGLIMSANIPVAAFEGRVVTPLLPALTPLCFRHGGDLAWWLENRSIDKHRTNSRILKRILRLNDTSDFNTVLRVHGVTITDNFWIKPEEESDLTWEQVKFSSDYFADIALKGNFDSYSKEFSPHELRSPTPELTNIGSFEKCWRLIDGKWVLYKSGSLESHFSEIFTYRLGEAFGFRMAAYELDPPYLFSEDFTLGQYNYEPAANLVFEDDEYSLSYDKLKELKPGLEREYLDILFMDALVFNVDRNTFNYGVIRDRTTGEVISMAPNFDNNLALISRGYASDLARIANPFIDMFSTLLQEKAVSYLMPELTQKQLQRLVQDCCPTVDVRRDYIVQFIWQNYQRLRTHISGGNESAGKS